MLKVNHTLVKATATVALTICGLGAINAVKTNSHVQAATLMEQVKIKYVPGYCINIWTSYDNGHFTGKRAQDGSTWNLMASAIDSKGNKWYEIGQGQWILAKYTVKASSASSTKTTKTAAVTAKKKTTKKSSQATGNAAAVVALAKSEAGKSYVWGATGSNSFDCSGLTQYVYEKAAGINITRTTYTQVNQGKAVSLSNLEPGDLLFWGSASAPYHVGIYLGNGQYIHAATPSQGVVIQTLSSYFYPSTARRILN